MSAPIDEARLAKIEEWASDHAMRCHKCDGVARLVIPRTTRALCAACAPDVPGSVLPLVSSFADAIDLVAEVRRLTEIIAGRTTPPTDEEMRAHDVAGGSWLVWWGRESYTIAPAWLPYRRPGYRLKPWDLALRWIALDAEGRPCAWPTAEVSRGD
jgi:hypothetical protein